MINDKFYRDKPRPRRLYFKRFKSRINGMTPPRANPPEAFCIKWFNEWSILWGRGSQIILQFSYNKFNT